MKYLKREDIHTGLKPHRDPFPEELMILALIAEQVTIPEDLLARLLNISPEQLGEILEKFVRYRWVKVKQFFIADQRWVWLRQNGARHLKGKAPYRTLRIEYLPHRRALCWARLKLESEYPDGEWICERKLFKQKNTAHHIPDAVFIVRRGGKVERWAIEAELSQKADSVYRGIVADRLQHDDRRRRYDQLKYLCTPKVARQLRKLPETADNPKVTIEETFQDPRQISNFQWAWSPWSGPGEVRASRRAEMWEVRILQLICEQGAIPLDQLARFLEGDFATAQRIADHLDRAGFICQGKGLVDEPSWVWATKTGARLSGTGLKASVPTLTSTPMLRLMNELRLHVAERDWDVQWWSGKLLRKGGLVKGLPSAIADVGDEQHAFYVEHARRASKELVPKYDAICKPRESKGDFDLEDIDRIVVFCSPRRVKTFEQLKRERHWTKMHVQSFDALDTRPKGRARDTKQPLVEMDVKELPPEVIRIIQKAERLASPPSIKSAARRRGRGFRRWRVVTSSRAWRVTHNAFGWFIRPCDQRDPQIEPASPPPGEDTQRSTPQSRKERPPRRRPKDPPDAMVIVDPWEVPNKALEVIQQTADLPTLPQVIGASRRGYSAWRIETNHDTWYVTCRGNKWKVVLSE